MVFFYLSHYCYCPSGTITGLSIDIRAPNVAVAVGGCWLSFELNPTIAHKNDKWP